MSGDDGRHVDSGSGVLTAVEGRVDSWKVEWTRRQRAMELRARVRLHALAMDMMKKPNVSPVVLQDPILRRDLLLSLHEQSAMDIRSESLSRCYSSSSTVL